MCKTQRAISEWCLDPMDCLCMLHKHIQSFLAYSIHHSHSFTPTPLLFFFGFFWLGFSSLSFSLFLISCCFSNSSPYLFFISSLCLGFLSSISLDRWLLFFFCPHIFLLVMFAVSFFSSVFSLVSVFLPVPLCVFGHCSAAAERPPPPLPCLLERREIKHENANRHLQPMTNACTATAQKTSPLLNRHLASPDFISYLIRETQEWKGKSLFHFAIRTQPSCSL